MPGMGSMIGTPAGGSALGGGSGFSNMGGAMGSGNQWLGPSITALGGIMGYLGAKDAKDQQGPWSKKHAMWAMDEAQRLYSSAVMAPMFQMQQYGKAAGGPSMEQMMALYNARYQGYNPGGNPVLGGGGYLGENTFAPASAPPPPTEGG